MPGQEKMVMDFYQKNPSAVASLRGTVYEDKIINLIKEKAKANKKEVSKDQAEKILKESQNETLDKNLKTTNKKEAVKKSTPQKTKAKSTKAQSSAKKIKKVSKK